MATKKRQPSASGAAPAPSRKKNLEKVMYRMRPDQIAALREEAFRRAQAAGLGRPDASELVREAVDAWLATRTERRR